MGFSSLKSVGSSPLARGLLGSGDAVRARARIIPARAGFTYLVLNLPGVLGDHPRSRGVYMTGPVLSGALPWIIPARAGFTAAQTAGHTYDQDHPRSRGVYTMKPFPRRTISGSSPLARGLRSECREYDSSSGIIPARAGFTRAPRRPCGPQKDHPRSRGVYGRGGSGPRWRAGSSPLARGLLIRRIRRLALRRIIPARAGFTQPFARASRN